MALRVLTTSVILFYAGSGVAVAKVNNPNQQNQEIKAKVETVIARLNKGGFKQAAAGFQHWLTGKGKSRQIPDALHTKYEKKALNHLSLKHHVEFTQSLKKKLLPGPFVNGQVIQHEYKWKTGFLTELTDWDEFLSYGHIHVESVATFRIRVVGKEAYADFVEWKWRLQDSYVWDNPADDSIYNVFPGVGPFVAFFWNLPGLTNREMNQLVAAKMAHNYENAGKWRPVPAPLRKSILLCDHLVVK